MKPRRHRETHKSGRTSWLRAAVLGSNDAIVSVSSLMIGVGAAAASKQATLVAGVAGLVAGAMSMAVGEFVSVSAQRDSEQADIARESEELATSPEAELHELAAIYHHRGLDKDLAMEVAKQLSAHDRLGAHVRDELGIDARTRARPFQAAWISAVGFATFAMLPILGLIVAPASLRLVAIAAVTLVWARSGCSAVGSAAPRWAAPLCASRSAAPSQWRSPNASMNVSIRCRAPFRARGLAVRSGITGDRGRDRDRDRGRDRGGRGRNDRRSSAATVGRCEPRARSCRRGALARDIPRASRQVQIPEASGWFSYELLLQ
jgi:VIT1/CCC1 family predicted Fe2+/Mn2+ transporter